MTRFAFILSALIFCVHTWAASPWAGVWVMRSSNPKINMTMTLEEAGGGWKITYRIPTTDDKGRAKTVTMTLDTKLDGKDAENLIDGKPSGQTMAIRRIDDRHVATVLKMNGKETGSGVSELSADGKVIKAEGLMSMGSGAPSTKTVQYWDKQ